MNSDNKNVKWHTIFKTDAESTEVMNTKTGCLVKNTYKLEYEACVTISSCFISGEHWDLDKRNFVKLDNFAQGIEIDSEL